MEHLIDHVKLLVIMGNLLVGAAMAIYLYQAYRRYGHASLKPIFYNILFYNLLVLTLFIGKYYDINIRGETQQLSEENRRILYVFLAYVFIIGFSYASLGTYLAFMGKGLSSAFRRRLAVSTALLVAGIFIDPLLPRESLPWKIHYQFYENFGVVFLLLEFVLMIALPFKARRLKDGGLSRVAQAFSYLYISRYPGIALLLVVPQPLRLMLALLYPNIVPYIWFRFFMLPYIKRAAVPAASETDLEGIAHNYRLSPREMEILGLIMEGKSNRDIEESLFISYHTVKNHVYNIYRKLGVKTRFELLHLVSSGGTVARPL